MKMILLVLVLMTFTAQAAVGIKVNIIEVAQFMLTDTKALSKIKFNVRMCQSLYPGDFVAVVEQRPDLQLLTIQEAVGVECTGPVETMQYEITTDQLKLHKPIRLMNLLSVETVLSR